MRDAVFMSIALKVDGQRPKTVYMAKRRQQMSQNRRRNNPLDMTIEEQIIKAREEVCDSICKYKDQKRHGKLSQHTLDEICKHDCPLKTL